MKIYLKSQTHKIPITLLIKTQECNPSSAGNQQLLSCDYPDSWLLTLTSSRRVRESAVLAKDTKIGKDLTYAITCTSTIREEEDVASLLEKGKRRTRICKSFSSVSVQNDMKLLLRMENYADCRYFHDFSKPKKCKHYITFHDIITFIHKWGMLISFWL